MRVGALTILQQFRHLSPDLPFFAEISNNPLLGLRSMSAQGPEAPRHPRCAKTRHLNLMGPRASAHSNSCIRKAVFDPSQERDLLAPLRTAGPDRHIHGGEMVVGKAAAERLLAMPCSPRAVPHSSGPPSCRARAAPGRRRRRLPARARAGLTARGLCGEGAGLRSWCTPDPRRAHGLAPRPSRR
jgi:hypothetical protein